MSDRDPGGEGGFDRDNDNADRNQEDPGGPGD